MPHPTILEGLWWLEGPAVAPILSGFPSHYITPRVRILELSTVTLICSSNGDRPRDGREVGKDPGPIPHAGEAG